MDRPRARDDGIAAWNSPCRGRLHPHLFRCRGCSRFAGFFVDSGTSVARNTIMFGKTKKIAAIALIFLAGCESITGTKPERALWDALEIQNYDFVYQVSCFCGFTIPNPVKLSVRNGVVSAAVPIGSFVGTLPPLSVYPTID